MTENTWSDAVGQYLSGVDGRITTREVMRDALKIDLSRINPQGSEAQRVGQVMRDLGYYKVRLSGSPRGWAWQRDALNAIQKQK